MRSLCIVSFEYAKIFNKKLTTEFTRYETRTFLIETVPAEYGGGTWHMYSNPGPSFFKIRVTRDVRLSYILSRGCGRVSGKIKELPRSNYNNIKINVSTIGKKKKTTVV